MTALLVAETDDQGDIACVWHWTAERRMARPITSESKIAFNIMDVEVFGATREAIADWLRRKTGTA
jgi:hypothetical protein